MPTGPTDSLLAGPTPRWFVHRPSAGKAGTVVEMKKGPGDVVSRSLNLPRNMLRDETRTALRYNNHPPCFRQEHGCRKGLSYLMESKTLERRTVSPKTAGDGMVEITKPVAEKLLTMGKEFDLEAPAGRGRVSLTSMPCTCRGKDNPHEHWFLKSELFRSLLQGSEIELALKGNRIVASDRSTDR